ncbi:hypothetical protein MRS44_012195 [Fusarium solani]|uniref:uncharacterized protein n=1 Tax=Fusarium solani TaxID=169388 RepID=UPI0032C49B2E|nr:hypothetical protein MRS44_012195 [Fusarium solani]
MALPDEDTQVRVASEAAEIFVTHYYQAVNKQSALLPFYINSSSRYPIPADISINGAVLSAPTDYSKLLEAQGQGALYELESFDAHVVNPSFGMGAPENVYEGAKVEKNGGRMSILVNVMGKVQYGKGREAPQKMFHETFVLVPNWEAMVKNPPKGGWPRDVGQTSTTETALAAAARIFSTTGAMSKTQAASQQAIKTKGVLNEDSTKANVSRKPRVKGA